MRCDDVRENLVAYLDGEMTPEERERVASHIANCPDCRREKEGLGSTGDLLDVLRGGTETAPDLAARVLDAAHGERAWCRHIAREIVAFHDGELTETEARPVREHLAECADCAADARALERVARALPLWEVEAPGVDLVPRIVPGAGKPKGRLRRLLPAVAAAALVLLVAGLAALLGLFGGGNGSGVAEPPAEVLANLEIFETETLDLLEADPDLLELAEQVELLETLSEEDLAMLGTTGG